MAQFVKRRPKAQAAIAMTSLMDVLTIILVFLLANYGEDPASKEVPKFVSLPTVVLDSNRATRAPSGIDLYLGKGKVGLDKEDFAFAGSESDLSNLARKLSEKVTQKKGEKPVILIHADKKASYEEINKVLLSAGMAGITEFEFVAEASHE